MLLTGMGHAPCLLLIFRLSTAGRVAKDAHTPFRKIIHIDMDAFYASVEQRDHPEYRGKPLIVGGLPEGRGGVVATASYEARRFGVRSAMPSKKALQLCPQAIFVRPRFDAYREVSRKIREIFARYTDLIEPLSLDEAYLDVTTDKLQIGSAIDIAKQSSRPSGMNCS
jgi:DNA polymerase-4